MVGSHEVVRKGHVNTENGQMVSIGAIFTSTSHACKAAESMAKLIIQMCSINYSQLCAFQDDMEPFKSHLSICGCLASLRIKPQQKQPEQHSVLIPVRIVS